MTVNFISEYFINPFGIPQGNCVIEGVTEKPCRFRAKSCFLRLNYDQTSFPPFNLLPSYRYSCRTTVLLWPAVPTPALCLALVAKELLRECKRLCKESSSQISDQQVCNYSNSQDKQHGSHSQASA